MTRIRTGYRVQGSGCRVAGARVANGVQVAWLIEGDERKVTVCRAGMATEVLEVPEIGLGEGVMAGFELTMARVWGQG